MASYLDPELPPIAITTRDFERLSRLANGASGRYADTADFLGRELDRARVVCDVEALPGLVTMGSQVEYRDDATGQARAVRLVYPGEADAAEGKISVLTPIGAALIGLSVSQRIEYQTRDGGWRSLTVLGVKP